MTLTWDAGFGAVIYGMPHATLLTRPTVAGFDDISITGQKVAFPRELDDDHALLPTTFQTVLFGTPVGSSIQVVTNGYFVFAPFANGDNFRGSALPTTRIEAFAVAPYWADLDSELADGGIPGDNFPPTGLTATIWLENPAGTIALPIGINQDVITANTAYRFSPR